MPPTGRRSGQIPGHRLDPHSAAEIISILADGSGRRGSGYRVSETVVLTAAHVVVGAAQVRVRFDADRSDEVVGPATIAWLDETIDVAILEGTWPLPDTVNGAPPAIRFGWVDDIDTVLSCSSVGFPRYKLRRTANGWLRDSSHVQGTIAALSHRREGTLEIRVDARTVTPTRTSPHGRACPALPCSPAVFSSA